MIMTICKEFMFYHDHDHLGIIITIITIIIHHHHDLRQLLMMVTCKDLIALRRWRQSQLKSPVQSIDLGKSTAFNIFNTFSTFNTFNTFCTSNILNTQHSAATFSKLAFCAKKCKTLRNFVSNGMISRTT